MIPVAMVERFRTALATTSRLATEELKGLWYAIGTLSADEIRDYLVLSMPALTQKHGDIAALAAAEFYEDVRTYQIGGRYSATLAGAVPANQVESSVRYAASHLFNGDRQAFMSSLTGSLDRYVKQPGRDTVLQNGVRDPARPRFARIPSGTACAWCLMLAGRGFVYHSRESAGGDIHHGDGFDRFHPNCACQVVMDFTDSPGVEGYDSAEYERMYLDARNDAGSGDVHEIMRSMRRLYPDSVSDGVYND